MTLHQTTEAVATTINTMSRQGLTQARITLTPGSLGEVKVVLTQTDAGLTARVVADHADAAQTLMQSADELRGRLESTGTTLLRLDIGTSDQPGAGNGSPSGSDAQGAAQQGAGGRGSAGQGGDGDEAEPDAEASTRQITVAWGDSSLVNVLA